MQFSACLLALDLSITALRLDGKATPSGQVHRGKHLQNRTRRAAQSPPSGLPCQNPQSTRQMPLPFGYLVSQKGAEDGPRVSLLARPQRRTPLVLSARHANGDRAAIRVWGRHVRRAPAHGKQVHTQPLGRLLCVDPACNPLRHLFWREEGRVQHPDLPTGGAALPRRPPRPLHAGSALSLDDVWSPLRIHRVQPLPRSPIEHVLGGPMGATRPETINTDHIRTIEQTDGNPIDLKGRGTGQNFPE